MKQIDTSSLPGMLIIGSAPSGAGKNSIFSEILKLQSGAVVESVSCTTRGPRPGEVDGRDYFFISQEKFEEMDRGNYFLEAGGNHDGRRYGTPLAPVLADLERGVDVLLIVEVNGARIALERITQALTIFITPAGETLSDKSAQLEAQLRKRGHDTHERIQDRLRIAVKELDQAALYQHVVVNAPGQLERAVEEVNSIINQARKRRRASLAAERKAS
jgi:guanylate kinase